MSVKSYPWQFSGWLKSKYIHSNVFPHLISFIVIIPSSLLKCQLSNFFTDKRQNKFFKYGIQSKTQLQLLEWRIQLEPKDVLKSRIQSVQSLIESNFNFIVFFKQHLHCFLEKWYLRKRSVSSYCFYEERIAESFKWLMRRSNS